MSDITGTHYPACNDRCEGDSHYFDNSKVAVAARDAEWRAKVEALLESWPPIGEWADPLQIRSDCRDDLRALLDSMGGKR